MREMTCLTRGIKAQEESKSTILSIKCCHVWMTTLCVTEKPDVTETSLENKQTMHSISSQIVSDTYRRATNVQRVLTLEEQTKTETGSPLNQISMSWHMIDWYTCSLVLAWNHSGFQGNEKKMRSQVGLMRLNCSYGATLKAEVSMFAYIFSLVRWTNHFDYESLRHCVNYVDRRRQK